MAYNTPGAKMIVVQASQVIYLEEKAAWSIIDIRHLPSVNKFIIRERIVLCEFGKRLFAARLMYRSIIRKSGCSSWEQRAFPLIVYWTYRYSNISLLIESFNNSTLLASKRWASQGAARSSTVSISWFSLLLFNCTVVNLSQRSTFVKDDPEYFLYPHFACIFERSNCT